MWRVCGAAFAERGEWSGGRGEGGGARFGDVQDVEGATGARFDLRAG